MASVQFELGYEFDVSPRIVWNELVDWKGHEQWVPSTHVELHGPGDGGEIGDEFTAWTGPAPSTSIGKRLSLQDRMRVDQLAFDDTGSAGTCLVTKIGPLLTGTASFTVTPRGNGSHVAWVEDVAVRFAPQVLAPLLGRIGTAGFRFSFTRLAKRLATG